MEIQVKLCNRMPTNACRISSLFVFFTNVGNTRKWETDTASNMQRDWLSLSFWVLRLVGHVGGVPLRVICVCVCLWFWKVGLSWAALIPGRKCDGDMYDWFKAYMSGLCKFCNKCQNVTFENRISLKMLQKNCNNMQSPARKYSSKLSDFPTCSQ